MVVLATLHPDQAPIKPVRGLKLLLFSSSLPKVINSPFSNTASTASPKLCNSFNQDLSCRMCRDLLFFHLLTMVIIGNCCGPQHRQILRLASLARYKPHHRFVSRLPSLQNADRQTSFPAQGLLKSGYMGPSHGHALYLLQDDAVSLPSSDQP